MKRCLRCQLRVLFHIPWLALLPPVLGLLLGWEAAAMLHAYIRRAGALETAAALAYALDIRHFIPLAGAAWSAAFLGMEFDARGAAGPLSLGYGRGQVFGSKLILYLLGCAVISAAQITVVLPSVTGWQDLPGFFLLRCFGLRLLLDLGMAAPSAAIVPVFGENLYGRALTGLYGLLFWRLMGSHSDLWLPEAGRPGFSALWPLAALPLGLGVYWLALRRKEF